MTLTQLTIFVSICVLFCINGCHHNLWYKWLFANNGNGRRVTTSSGCAQTESLFSLCKYKWRSPDPNVARPLGGALVSPSPMFSQTLPRLLLIVMFVQPISRLGPLQGGALSSAVLLAGEPATEDDSVYTMCTEHAAAAPLFSLSSRSAVRQLNSLSNGRK